MSGRSLSERFADRCVAGMGSLRFIGIQTAVVGLWIAANVAVIALRFDPYPFILLNLMFSTQAAYAAPLILLAGRRADAKRDGLANHHYDQEQALAALLEANTVLTSQVHALTQTIHDHVVAG